MFSFIRSLLAGVARGLGWAARMGLGLVGDTVEGLFTGLWRYWFPPEPEREESTAEVLRQVAGLITGKAASADSQAETERPAPKARHVPEAVMRRRMERALAYTQAVMTGDRLPSLAHVGPELAYELGRLRTPADAEPMHRELMGALGMDAENWSRPRREVQAPGPDRDDTPALRYA